MSNRNSNIKKYYEEWWENPNDPRDFIFNKLNKIVDKRLPKGQGKRVLDVGSGKGKIVSFLVKKGYRVTAVELNENFVKDLTQRFQTIEILEGDFNLISIDNSFDDVTAIEFVQNLDREVLKRFLVKVATISNHLRMNISNRFSLHGFWTVFRGFQLPFVFTYTPREIEQMLRTVGFHITYKKGIGLITPITLFSGFRWKIIPIWFAKIINSIGDRIFPRFCHLYYIEAEKINKEA
ncbi:methyltransferase domain-containing protein [Candidatus Gottesmanbacteria bacterium]|nr:methyltransferase domain-containing protein [Candidatus Gottesmanbacteria bacterium]MBM3712104.1 methyltransferase domain-containing protein [Actinomycetota bacterium]